MFSTQKSAAVLCLIFLSFILLFPAIVFAQGTLLDSTNGASFENCNKCVITDATKLKNVTVDVCKQYCGAYGTNDFFQILVDASDIILGVVGALSLLAFVAGGMMFLLSGGSQTWVTRGRATLVGAVIGLFIVFFSYTMIKFLKDKFVSNTFDTDIMTTGVVPGTDTVPAKEEKTK
jgi:hypothetical protein